MDEFFYLQDVIKTRKISDIKLQLNIAQNPHTKHPEQFFKALDNLDQTSKIKPKLDKVGLDSLKAVLANNPRFVVK